METIHRDMEKLYTTVTYSDFMGDYRLFLLEFISKITKIGFFYVS